MFLKNFVVAAVFAVGSLTATMSTAATCDVGSCESTLIGNDSLADGGVLWNIDQIGAGEFSIDLSFLNDQPQDGVTIAAGLTSLLGTVSNLVLEITSPGAIAQVYNLSNDTPQKIQLIPTQGSTIEFTLSGTSASGINGALPDLNLTISAVPLPAGVLLMGTALAGFGVMRRRRKS